MWEEELGKIGEWGELEEGMVEGEVERVEEKVEVVGEEGKKVWGGMVKGLEKGKEMKE